MYDLITVQYIPSQVTVVNFMCDMILMFDSREDMYAQESIELLDRSGIKFKHHEEHGIEVDDFAELLMTSGVILSDDIKWLSFHRYLTRLQER